MIKFSVSRVEKEPILLEGTEGPEFWALPENDPYTSDEEVEYELQVRSAAGSILVTGWVRGTVNAVCGRCLEPVTMEISAEDIELYYAKSDIHEEELDITADVRDELLIELPMNPLCSDECEGLCPVCGVNRNKTECQCSRQGNLAWGALDSIVTEEK
ncbi:MAG: DUF177 domain-containing protein [Lentisphaeria bacterium]|jgi:uncharacterized protein|nr:DUF177 domain-containing protein [Lentisphaeria bacterium]